MSRTLSLDVLDDLRVASPCPMKWEQMESMNDPGDRIRHCGQCDLNVYNVANLSREETLDLVMSHAARGERLCAQLYRRADGTLITRDCPIGLAAIRRKTRELSCRVAAAMLLGVSLSLAAIAGAGPSWYPSVKGMGPVRQASSWLDRFALRITGKWFGSTGSMIAGDICLPEPPANVPESAHRVYYESIIDG